MKPGDMKHSAMNRHFFIEPRICARCREGGRYVQTRPGRQEWICGRHK